MCLLSRSAPGGAVEVYPRGEKNGVRREMQMASSAQGWRYMTSLQSIISFFPICLSSILPSVVGYQHLFGWDLVYPDDLVSLKVLPSHQHADYPSLEFGNLPSPVVSLWLTLNHQGQSVPSPPHLTPPWRALVASSLCFLAKEQTDSSGPHHMPLCFLDRRFSFTF